jgi:cell division protein FtsN
MARDYKHTRRSAPSRTPGWAWMLGGLLIGLFVAFLVYLKDRPVTGPVASPARSTVPAALPPQEARDVRKERAEPVPPPPKPRFDFYTILPEMEVVVPEPPRAAEAPRQAAAPPAAPPPGTYLLQAGAFRRYEEADRLKASLALIGVEANIHTVTINLETWHRVRIGPYTSLEQLDRVRTRLREHAIETVLLKVGA